MEKENKNTTDRWDLQLLIPYFIISSHKEQQFTKFHFKLLPYRYPIKVCNSIESESIIIVIEVREFSIFKFILCLGMVRPARTGRARAIKTHNIHAILLGKNDRVSGTGASGAYSHPGSFYWVIFCFYFLF